MVNKFNKLSLNTDNTHNIVFSGKQKKRQISPHPIYRQYTYCLYFNFLKHIYIMFLHGINKIIIEMDMTRS